MSGSGETGFRKDEYNASQTQCWRVPGHGCTCEISKDSRGDIHHLGVAGHDSLPSVRSYPDGIKVGCTFITNDAVELLYKWHKEFRYPTPTEKVHQ